MKKKSQKQVFSVVKRAKSFTYASRGVWLVVKTTHNFWIHLVILFMAVAAGVYFQIPSSDWTLLVFAAGLVLASEAINTAIEIDVDFVSPRYHPLARDTKDVAAGAVLIAAATAAIVGLFIFGPYVWPLLGV